MRAWRIAAAAVGLMAVLGGCVRLLSDTTLHADDTFSQVVIVALDPAVAEQAGGLGDPGLDGLSPDAVAAALAGVIARHGDQVTVRDYADGSLEGVEVLIDRLPLEEFNAVAAELAAATGGHASVERSGDLFTVTLTPPEDDGSGPPSDLGDLGLLAGAVDVNVYYTFPGLVRSTTAGTVDGRTVRLGLDDALAGGEVVMVGGAEPEIHWAPILRWALIAAAFALIVGGAWWLVAQDRRKRRSTALPPHRPSGEQSSAVGMLGPPAGE